MGSLQVTPLPSILEGESIRAADWSSDGQHLAASTDDGHVLVWNQATGNVTRHPVATGHALAVVRWCPTRDEIACTGWGLSAILLTPHARCMRELDSGALRSYRGASWSPDGSCLALVDQNYLNPVVWQRPPHAPVNYEAADSPLRAVSWASDGRRLAAVSDIGTLVTWDTGGRRLDALPATSPQQGQSGPAVTWIPTGSMIACGDQSGAVALWNPLEKRMIGSRQVSSVSIVDLAFSAPGNTLICSDGNGAVRVLHPDTLSEVAIIPGHDNWVGDLHVAVHPSRRLLAIPSRWRRNVAIVALDPTP